MKIWRNLSEKSEKLGNDAKTLQNCYSKSIKLKKLKYCEFSQYVCVKINGSISELKWKEFRQMKANINCPFKPIN
jgi:hypothetical protein